MVGGFGALKHEGMMLEEEARRNARGEFVCGL